MSESTNAPPKTLPHLNVELHLRLLRENGLKPSTLASALKKLGSIRAEIKAMKSDEREVS